MLNLGVGCQRAGRNPDGFALFHLARLLAWIAATPLDFRMALSACEPFCPALVRYPSGVKYLPRAIKQRRAGHPKCPSLCTPFIRGVVSATLQADDGLAVPRYEGVSRRFSSK